MTQEESGQLTLFDLDPDIWSGKMSPELSPPRAERTSARCLRKPAELLTVPFLYLDLREGYGSLLGPYWEINSHLLGGYTTLNTGPSHKGAKESILSQILEATPHHKYYLSKTACLGILRRAKKRGKELPPVLKQALEIQAGIRPTE
ncbi:hypothetical protein HNQ56_003915 [Anaerotaenia torta]